MPTNRQWILRRRPAGEIVPDDLELIETVTPELHDGEVLVRNIYLSLDPTNRIWMSDQDQYLPPVQIGEVMRGGAIGVVEQSRNAALPEERSSTPAWAAGRTMPWCTRAWPGGCRI